MARMPVPPIPPPGGPPPMPVGAGNSRGDEDPLSPTTIILNYLRSKGVQPNADNIRAAVLANARDPGQAGADPIPGLREAGPEDSGRGTGRGSSVAGKVESGGGPNTQRADMGRGTAPFNNPPVDASPNTSAQPTTSTPLNFTPNDPSLSVGPPGNLGAAIALGGGAGGAAYGLGRYMGSGGQPTPGDAVPPMPDVGAGVPGAAQPPAAPPKQLTYDPAQPTDMEAAMQKAMAPGGPVTLDQPYVPNPADVIAAGSRLPPGVTPTDAANVQLRTNPQAAVNPPYIGESPLPPRGRVTVQQVPSVMRAPTIADIARAARLGMVH